MITSLIRVFAARSVMPFAFRSDYSIATDLNVKNPGLYFHIPFCKNLCSFCPYYKVKYDKVLLKDFIRALIKEIDVAAALLCKGEYGREKDIRRGDAVEKYDKEKYNKGNGRKSEKIRGEGSGKRDIESIYFGGGSPALAIDYLPKIINLVKSLFDLKRNTGIELHPTDINEALLEKLKDCGFNMVSIGVQSFQDRCISALGRERINSVEKLELVKKFNFDVVDVDLIFGIPGQREGDLVRDFKTAAENGATQISAYPFIEFSYARLKNKPLDRRQKKKMLESLVDASKKLGYIRTSIWTFSRGDSLKYSSVTRDNFIGFGPSAATLLKDIFKINTFSISEYIKYLNNNNAEDEEVRNINNNALKYLTRNNKDGSNDKNNKLPTALTLKFNPRTRALYWLFWSAYKLYISEDNFYELFGKKLDNIFKVELFLAGKFGYIQRYNRGYKLTGKGAYIFHLIEQAYTRQYIDKTWRIASKNPWPERITLY